MDTSSLSLDRLSELAEFLDLHSGTIRARHSGSMACEGGMLYCVQCGAVRRMNLPVVSCPPFTSNPQLSITPEQIIPSLFVASCLQCYKSNTIVTYAGPDGPSLVVLPTVRGGLASPNAPEGVSYYLDQAHRCESMGAHSAAVTMYRAALEHLLFEQGYEVRMLGPKIQKLEEDIAAGTAKDWATKIDPDFMDVIKDLGNDAIHPNDGDISVQAKFDEELTRKVRAAFILLLEVVYEEPERRAKLLGELKAATKEEG